MTEEAGFPRCQAAKPRLPKAAARSYGTCVSRVGTLQFSSSSLGSPSPDGVVEENLFFLMKIARKTGNDFLGPSWGKCGVVSEVASMMLLCGEIPRASLASGPVLARCWTGIWQCLIGQSVEIYLKPCRLFNPGAAGVPSLVVAWPAGRVDHWI